jgi:glutamate synthase (NADPH/NADH) small chain
MRRLSPEEAVKTWDETLLGYSREEAMAEARRALSFDLGPAATRCPFDVDVPRFVQQVADGDFDAAVATIREAHEWPEVFGRACHKYCELAYVPGGKLTPTEVDGGRKQATPFISALEWAAGTYGDRSRAPFRPGPPTGRRIAVIGAGSAGLGCAWHLRRCGHDVDIFERESVPAGLLRTGYPTFRMSKAAVIRENDPTEWGARVHYDHAVEPADLARLVSDYDAVFFSIGRTPIRSLGIEGDDLHGVLTGLDFLRDTWFGHPPPIGPRAMVVGAGFTSYDVARTALRLGCSSVEIVYRRSVHEMGRPGTGELFRRVLEEEGVRFRFMADPTRIIGKEDKVAAVELIANEYGETDEAGKPSVRSVPGSEWVVEVDTVFRAVGETVDVQAFLEPLGVRMSERGFIEVDPVTHRSSHPRIWSGGDCIGTNGNEGAAYDALCAARGIDAFLAGHYDAFRAEAAQRMKDMRW